MCAMVLASRVLPEPGGPYRRIPCGREQTGAATPRSRETASWRAFVVAKL